MKTAGRLAVAALVVGMAASAAMADGMIVPVRRDIRVRGHWAVKYHHVKMTVRDQVASVNIVQEFVNTGRGMIEVEYLFPVPPAAAIDAMTLEVNGKEFKARLLKADEARKIYEDIVRKKKDPALLEYVGFGLYRTKAFPLEPGKPAKVIVHYDYVCKKDRDLVEVWYPLNTEKFSAKPIEDVKVTVDIKSKADMGAVYSPSHDLSVQRKGPRHVIATYHETKALPAIDFQMFYKAANRDVGATLLTYQPVADTDGYFMLLVSPNPRGAGQKAVPKDVVIVFDHSGSMSGKKIDQAKDALRFVLKNLNEKDRFNVIAYNDLVEPFFDALVDVSRKNLDETEDRLDRVDAGGGTNIHEALETAMKIICSPKRADAKRPAYVIFLTDGIPTVGRTPEQVKERVILADTSKANTRGARVFAFGIGYDVNIRLLDKLVGENRGKSDYVKPAENIETKIASLYAKIKNPVMTDLELSVKGLRLRDMYPRVLGDLFDGDQIVLVGRYSRAMLGRDADAQLVITGDYQGKRRGFEYPVTVCGPGRNTRLAFVEKLWAVRRVGFLMDQIQLHGDSKEIIDELVKLSKTYGIMTPYTSFLAEETTRLSSTSEVRRRMERGAKELAADTSGYRGQNAAMARQSLNLAMKAPAASGRAGGAVMFGNTQRDAYEEGELETVANVRQIGNQALYRRGRVWVAANASRLDAKRDADKIRRIERFSEEYFRLVRANTVEENQILASQREGEDLLITLRGQAYSIR